MNGAVKLMEGVELRFRKGEKELKRQKKTTQEEDEEEDEEDGTG